MSSSTGTTAEPGHSSGQAAQWTDFPLDAGLAMLNGWTGYLRSAISRGTGPLDFAEDVAEWWRASTVRTKPSWVTDNREELSWPQARLLDFSTNRDVLPTLLLPPQAGHASTIADYSPDQSQVLTARAAGLTNFYVLDWHGATAETSESSIETYIQIIDETIDHLGGKANLIGDCQGGWLATIYTALHPEKVNTLSMGGAPIDYHIGGSAIQDWVKRANFGDEMVVYRAMVALGGGNHLGSSQITGFKLLEPAEEVKRLSALWQNIADPRYVQRHIDFTNWFEWGQDVPGTFYLWIVEHLFIRNELIKKKLVVGDSIVDLAAIDCPLFLLAGSRDHITPAPQQFALADYASTPEENVTKDVVDAGHLGLFMGRSALRDHWAPILEQIADLSRS